jgi:hypothetical protein
MGSGIKRINGGREERREGEGNQSRQGDGMMIEKEKKQQH